MSVTNVTVSLAARYRDIINLRRDYGEIDPHQDNPRISLVNLIWMCETIMTDGHNMPVDKSSRWLGFIQGCLATRGFISVDEERDVSRSLFHAAYQAEGKEVPATYERPEPLPMKGLFWLLSDEQREAALNYQGEESFGPEELKNK